MGPRVGRTSEALTLQPNRLAVAGQAPVASALIPAGGTPRLLLLGDEGETSDLSLAVWPLSPRRSVGGTF